MQETLTSSIVRSGRPNFNWSINATTEPTCAWAGVTTPGVLVTSDMR
jgi:hypothetical protein